jgi:hypothetical protein
LAIPDKRCALSGMTNLFWAECRAGAVKATAGKTPVIGERRAVACALSSEALQAKASARRTPKTTKDGYVETRK